MEAAVTPTSTNSEGLTEKPATEPKETLLKTPVRPGKVSKRKHSDTTSKPEEGGSAKKKRRGSTGAALTRVVSPGTLLKPALTERQQMALLMQMTDPSKQQSPGSPAVSVGVATPETTPKRLQRKNERGETPLHIAAIKGDLKTVVSMLKQGADVKIADHAGWTPLHEACNYGHSEVVRELIAHGADTGAVGMDGDTPLHDAVVNGHLETVRVLLEHGGNPHRANDKGLSPLDIVTHPEIRELLKSCDTGGANNGSHSHSSSEEQPCPKKSDEDERPEDDCPVFSPEMTTPTKERSSTPPRDTAREFSDVSSSESDSDDGQMTKEGDSPDAAPPSVDKQESDGEGSCHTPAEVSDQSKSTTLPTIDEILMSIPLSKISVNGKSCDQTPTSTTDGEHSDRECSKPLPLPVDDSAHPESDIEGADKEKIPTDDGNKSHDQSHDQSESLSVSLDWNSIKSPPGTPSLLVSHGPIRTQSEDGSEVISLNENTPPQTNETVITFRSGSGFPPSTGLSLGKSQSGPPSPQFRGHSNLSIKRSMSQESLLLLPPKLRQRPVARSALLTQRINHQAAPVESCDIPSVPLVSEYRSQAPISPKCPETVYPPIPASLYQQFTAQEVERARLATTHLVEQDRLRLALVQELSRAQGRARRGPVPLSACSLLLEKLLPQGAQSRLELEQSCQAESGLDTRLLSGLVQDVWDKFRSLKQSLVSRQAREAESLWLSQKEQWLLRSSLSHIPSSHVPLVCTHSPRIR